MKILTLNTHSLQEEQYAEKLEWFVEGVLAEMPDIIALQEVNQTADAEFLPKDMLTGQKAEGMRLDYIWCSHKRKILSCRVMFNGIREPVVSDHFGVTIEIKE